MNKGILLSALSSGEGKTTLSRALLYKISKLVKVQAFKAGPDYIDPQFHRAITNKASINLDLFMMNETEVNSLFHHYLQDHFAIVEGVMGLYDGLDKGFSTYDLAKTLKIPVILIVNAKGSYSTISPILKGIREYRKDNYISGVILNHVSTENHYNLIKKQLHQDHPDLKIYGWVPKLDKVIPSRHLGLDLNSINDSEMEGFSEEVLKNIDIQSILNSSIIENDSYNSLDKAFTIPEYLNNYSKKCCTVVFDEAFSFLYEDNLNFLKTVFKEVIVISSKDNQKIPDYTNSIYLPGGYVETDYNYNFLSNANDFKESLIHHFNKGTKIFAECAGLIYLGESIETLDNKSLEMTAILPLKFKMLNKRKRLGYYRAYDLKEHSIYKGHAFHYSDVIYSENGFERLGLFKDTNTKADLAGWQKDNAVGTYLHSFFRNQPELIQNFF